MPKFIFVNGQEDDVPSFTLSALMDALVDSMDYPLRYQYSAAPAIFEMDDTPSEFRVFLDRAYSSVLREDHFFFCIAEQDDQYALLLALCNGAGALLHTYCFRLSATFSNLRLRNPDGTAVEIKPAKTEAEQRRVTAFPLAALMSLVPAIIERVEMAPDVRRLDFGDLPPPHLSFAYKNELVKRGIEAHLRLGRFNDWLILPPAFRPRVSDNHVLTMKSTLIAEELCKRYKDQVWLSGVGVLEEIQSFQELDLTGLSRVAASAQKRQKDAVQRLEHDFWQKIKHALQQSMGSATWASYWKRRIEKSYTEDQNLWNYFLRIKTSEAPLGRTQFPILSSAEYETFVEHAPDQGKKERIHREGPDHAIILRMLGMEEASVSLERLATRMDQYRQELGWQLHERTEAAQRELSLQGVSEENIESYSARIQSFLQSFFDENKNSEDLVILERGYLAMGGGLSTLGGPRQRLRDLYRRVQSLGFDPAQVIHQSVHAERRASEPPLPEPVAVASVPENPSFPKEFFYLVECAQVLLAEDLPEQYREKVAQVRRGLYYEAAAYVQDNPIQYAKMIELRKVILDAFLEKLKTIVLPAFSEETIWAFAQYLAAEPDPSLTNRQQRLLALASCPKKLPQAGRCGVYKKELAALAAGPFPLGGACAELSEILGRAALIYLQGKWGLVGARTLNSSALGEYFSWDAEGRFYPKPEYSDRNLLDLFNLTLKACRQRIEETKDAWQTAGRGALAALKAAVAEKASALLRLEETETLCQLRLRPYEEARDKMVALIGEIKKCEEVQSRVFDSFMLFFSEFIQKFFGAKYREASAEDCNEFLASLHYLVDFEDTGGQIKFIPAIDQQEGAIVPMLGRVLENWKANPELLPVYQQFYSKMPEFEARLKAAVPAEYQKEGPLFYNGNREGGRFPCQYPLLKPASCRSEWMPYLTITVEGVSESKEGDRTPNRFAGVWERHQEKRAASRKNMYALRISESLSAMEEDEKEIARLQPLAGGDEAALSYAQRVGLFFGCIADPELAARAAMAEHQSKWEARKKQLGEECEGFNACVHEGNKLKLPEDETLSAADLRSTLENQRAGLFGFVRHFSLAGAS